MTRVPVLKCAIGIACFVSAIKQNLLGVRFNLNSGGYNEASQLVMQSVAQAIADIYDVELNPSLEMIQ